MRQRLVRPVGLMGLVAVAALLAGCSTAPAEDGGSTAPAPPSASSSTAPSASTSPLPVDHPTLWLCHPDQADNPCLGDLDAVIVSADGSRRSEPFRPATDPAFDCFYVYPTVSKATGRNAPLAVTPELVYVVRAQAALFQRVCRLYAPVYRQVTVQALFSGGFTDPAARALAHLDVASAWHDYLNTENEGRPVLLLGHSQGTGELVQLIQEEIDGNPAVLSRLVSAMLIGGQVTVRPGTDVGGSFQNVPACRSRSQTGCVVAYNTFAEPPPAVSFFGRTSTGRQVLCVNPAAPPGGRAGLDPYVPRSSAPGAQDVVGFTAYPDAVVGECRSGDGADWLQVGPAPGVAPPGDALSSDRDPAWGLHRIDVNVALGDLVDLAAQQAATFG